MRIHLLLTLLAACAISMVSEPYVMPRPGRVYDERSGDHVTITGRVLDAQGQAVFGAQVSAERADFTTGKLPTTKSDIRGNFRFKGLKEGAYTLYVAKEEDGYAPTDSAFHYGVSVDAPQVIVHERQAPPDVVIHLGPKASRLIGRIVDGESNKPVVWNVQVTLSRVDNPSYTYSTGPGLDGEFNILVPPVPFTMKVSAAGYEDWYYRNEGSEQRFDALEISDGTAKELIVTLRLSK